MSVGPQPTGTRPWLSGVLAAVVGIAFAAAAVVLALTGHSDSVVTMLAAGPPTIGATLALKVGNQNSAKLDEHGENLAELRNGGLATAVRAGTADLEAAIRHAIEMPTDLPVTWPPLSPEATAQPATPSPQA